MMRNRSILLFALSIIFFFSGFSALIYQVSWQRLLFANIGIDLTSITVIISVFMAGLGIGAFFGGRIADRFSHRIIYLFCFTELLIGLCGFISYTVLLNIGHWLAQSHWIIVSLFSFLVLILPTFLMGATLPLLTCYFNQKLQNIGQSIGILYFTNTLGAAFGSLSTSLFLFNHLTLSQTIHLAASINVSLAMGVACLILLYRKTNIPIIPQNKENDPIINTQTSIPLIYLLSFASGFLCLGLEVIWIRLISFSMFSVPQAFAITLGIFLIGIAIGAWFGKRICEQKDLSILDVAQYFFLSGCLDLLLLIISYMFMGTALFSKVALLLILISASVRGLIFPMVHHIGTIKNKNGKQISNVYFANVLGSSLAPILIGMVALDYLHTQHIYLLICLLSVLIFLICQIKLSTPILRIPVILISLGLIGSLWVPEKVLHSLSQTHYRSLIQLIENKHGIIQIYQDNDEHVVFGANVYDGIFNVNLLKKDAHDDASVNRIERAYLLTTLHSHPEKVLIIGLSTGSWAEILASMPEAKEITIVEINSAYQDLITQYDSIRPLLDDPRVHIITDDGRKWLRQHPKEKFDMVLMNTTWHWRAYTANLLSIDFIEMIHQHLNPQGILMYNSTGSREVFNTAIAVFPHVYQYYNMVVASNQAIDFPSDEVLSERLARLQWQNGQNVFTPVELPQAIKQIKSITFKPITKPFNQGEIITDNNMLTEFKYGLWNQVQK